jgi:hypothetical protein
VLDEGVARGEVHGGLVGGEHRHRARAVGERAEGEEHATVHELGVPGLMRGEVLRREGEVAALVEKDVPQGILHFRCLSRASVPPRCAEAVTKQVHCALPRCPRDSQSANLDAKMMTAIEGSIRVPRLDVLRSEGRHLVENAGG